MKTTTSFLLLLCVSLTCLGQTPIVLDFFNNPNPVFNFDSDSINQYIYIDTSQAGNVWQIGSPQKTYFDSAYSSQHAILTDTFQPYPAGTHSSFQIKVTTLPLYGGMLFGFLHKFDIDSLNDGGYVDVSGDGGNTWTNIVNYWGGMYYYTQNFYWNDDTISSGIPAFNGHSNGWVDSQVHMCYVPDTFLIRFNFISDSNQTNKEGWMIDNMYFQPASCDDINELSAPASLKLSPNPVQNQATFEYTLTKDETLTLLLYDITGKVVQRFFTSEKRTACAHKEILSIKESLPAGNYVLEMRNGRERMNIKMLKE